MAEEIVRQVFEVEDRMTPVIENITSSVRTLSDAFDEANGASAEVNREVADALAQSEKAAREAIKTEAKEAEATKQTVEAKKTKLTFLRNLVNQYNGPYKQALQRLVSTLESVRNANKETAQSIGQTGQNIGQATANIERYGRFWGSIINVFQSRFPRATQAVLVALKAIRVALIATGIGAIVVGVGLLIAAFVGLARSAGDTSGKLTTLQKIFIGFQAIINTTLGLFNKFREGIVALVNGTASFSKLLKGGVENLRNYGDTLITVNRALQQAKIASDEAERSLQRLDLRVAQSRDTLNQLRETAADSNKSTAERVRALQEAGRIEAQIEDERRRIIALRLRAAIEERNANAASGRDTKETQLAINELLAESAALDADIKARQRADARSIQDLNREQIEQLKQLREAYARLQKQVESQLASARLENLTGVERIQAELKIAIDAINEFEAEVRTAAKDARQPFAAAPFAELRAIAEQKALEETRRFLSQSTQEAIENEKRKGLLIAQAITAASEEALNVEESRALLALEIEREALEKLLTEKRRFYAENEKLRTEAAEVELLTLEADLQQLAQREIDLRKAARQRVFNDRVEGINQEAELAETRLGIIQQSGDRTLTLEQFIEQERLKIQADALEQRVAALREFYGENSPEVQLALAQLQILRNAIEKGPNPFDPIRTFFKDALQINDEQLAQLEQIVGRASQAVGNIISAITEATEIQNRRYIELLDERIRATQGALDEEIRRQEAGYRNSADLYREQLRTLEEERARAEAESLDRQRRQANAQLAINTALQISEYILATVRLFNSQAPFGIVGIITALSGVAILASAVAQARLNAVKFAAPPAFREGTEFVEGPGDGRSDSITARISRGERILPADMNRQIGGRELSNDELVDIVRGAQQFNLTGILDKMKEDREVIVQLSQGIDYDRMEQLYRRANEEMTGKVISYLKTRPVRRLDDRGNEIISWEQGNRQHRQRVIRANKANEE